jgi:hypothetical protein
MRSPVPAEGTRQVSHSPAGHRRRRSTRRPHRAHPRGSSPQRSRQRVRVSRRKESRLRFAGLDQSSMGCDISIEDLVANAHSRVSRKLTAEERRNLMLAHRLTTTAPTARSSATGDAGHRVGRIRRREPTRITNAPLGKAVRIRQLLSDLGKRLRQVHGLLERYPNVEFGRRGVRTPGSEHRRFDHLDQRRS